MSPSRFNQNGPQNRPERTPLQKPKLKSKPPKDCAIRFLPKNWGRKSKAMTAAMSILMMNIATTCLPSTMQPAR